MTTARTWLYVTVTAVTIALGTAGHATAQIATGTLLGVVRDETGAALPGATVTVKSAATGATRGATSDAEGRYRISTLDPGAYEIRVELSNFKTAVRTGVV